MKRLLVILGLVIGLSTFSFAASNVRIVGCSVEEITTVVCSSTTATLLLSKNAYRRGYAVNNVGSYIIRKSTYASTSQAYGYPIAALGGEFSDNIEAYQGDIYAISTGTGSSTVWIVEKLGPTY